MNQEEKLEYLNIKHLIYVYITIVIIFIMLNYYSLSQILNSNNESFLFNMSLIIIFHIIFFGLFIIYIKKVDYKHTQEEIKKKNKEDLFIKRKEDKEFTDLVKYNKYKFEDYVVYEKNKIIDNEDIFKTNKKNKIIQKEIKKNDADILNTNNIFEFEELELIEINNNNKIKNKFI